MADALLGPVVEVLVEKAINLASEQIGRFVAFKKDLEKLRDTLTLIQALLHDAEERQVTQQFVKRWLEKLERVAFDAGNLLDDINYEMIRRKVEIQNQMKRKVCFFFSLSNPIAFRCKMANKIQKISMDLERINQEALGFGLQPQIGARDAPRVLLKNRETASVTIDVSFVGRENNVSEIVKKLAAPNNDETISVLPIVGMGGIGKTALARNVFNDPKIKEHFEKSMWVCVSDDFNANRLFKLMLESLEVPMTGVESKEAKVNRLKGSLDGKRYLLVLDDVWNKDSGLWNEFLGSLRGTSQAMGSWILVTTRERQVATITRISSPQDCSLKELSPDHCWLILKANALGARKVPNRQQEDIGFKIAEKCRGLPLAASVLGGMLRNKEIDEWQKLESGLQRGENNGIDEILKLSFDHLPYPSLKKCLAYCSIFPKDFEMERNQLIQLWAAEGFLYSNPRNNNMCMEEVGNMYFTILLDSNLFQDAKEDGYENVVNCKMHDLVHDMVQSIPSSKTLRLTESGSDDQGTFPIQYLALERSGEEMPFPPSERFKCITTLFLLEDRSLNDREISFFMLRVLSLRSSSVEELPKSIGKLTHLRYLDLSRPSIETMPDSLCRLYHLQTLRVEDCYSLTKFPENFTNLVNLRHFEVRNCANCKELPTLGHMSSLRSLHLERLDGITSIGPSFYGESTIHSGSGSQSPLKLFPALEHFILRYAHNLTEWTGAEVHDRELMVFPVLQTIEIYYCPELATFPSHFPSLKKLHIHLTKNGSAVMEYIRSSGVSTLTGLCLLFVNGFTELPNMLFQNNPKLADLVLKRCDDLTHFLDFPSEVLEGPNSQTVLELSQPHTCIDNSATQRLVGLESLEKLLVRSCDSLKSISIPKGDKYLTALRELEISHCYGLTHLSIPQLSESEWDSTSPPSLSATSPPPLLPLEKLRVYSCPDLISFPIDLTRTPSLSYLDISRCPKLTDLPKEKLCSLTSLRTLSIGPFSETTELHSFLYLFDALPPPHPYFPSLSELFLRGWSHWESLPEQLQGLSALTTLFLEGFGVKSLPDWFGKLSSLERLCLLDCKKLENLPSHQSMRSLTRLRKLESDGCPLLKERCKPKSSSSSTTESNSEWSKISGIPQIEIDEQQIRG
ncbi:putative disease resistance protein RGA3 [Coffea eugenioides]|uniref:putative disease resistance protein RGA3 n=1 Tax=Coffea eugenioides TaxID=49369 RepID=UPI000F60A26E|nr:putative disease resistance protein RGA3 [Coffea eugenioides]XP_027154935.1 putative disease resistance protein RGA3 [Coffea eugenioides]XP_027154936.1 putative disease resistance protein RGA3 [Coffea eugenioides]